MSSPTRSRKISSSSRFILGILLVALLGAAGCSSMPASKYHKTKYPKSGAYLKDKPTYAYKELGTVRSKIQFSSIDAEHDMDELCLSAFNQGAHDLLKKAKKEFKAKAVIDVRSVVYYLDGTKKLYPQAECADDGNEGQVLMQATAIQRLKKKDAPGEKFDENDDEE